MWCRNQIAEDFNDYRVNVVWDCDEDEKEEKFGQESEEGFSTSDLRGRLWGLFFVSEIVSDLEKI